MVNTNLCQLSNLMRFNDHYGDDHKTCVEITKSWWQHKAVPEA